jgi:hypothetical protein
MRALSFALCLLLCACANQERGRAVSLAGGAARECIQREATSVASTKTDLETAATAALARCSAEREAERRAFFALGPGYRDVIDPHVREVEAMQMDFARKLIALLRTRQ